MREAAPPFLAMPYPLDEALDALPGDYGKIARRLLRAARWTRGEVDGVQLDAGEALISERSEKLWGGLVLDREVSPAGRRALIRRVLERLERDGIAVTRAAHGGGPGNGPRNGPRNGPSPTVVRFVKFRAILWPSSAETAQETAQGPAQETARPSGPIPPGNPPVLPVPPESGPAGPRARDPRVEDLRQAVAEALQVNEEDFPVSFAKKAEQRDAVERRLIAQLERLGPDLTFRACMDVVVEAQRKGEPIGSMAYLPGWLETVQRRGPAAGATR